MKKKLALVLACVMAFSLVACGSKSSSDSTSSGGDTTSVEASDKSVKIGVSNIADSNEFCYTITHGAAEKAKEKLSADGYEVELIIMDQDNKYDTVVNHFENFVTMGVDAIITLSNQYAVGPAIVSANNAGIPVFSLTTKSVDGTYYYIGSNDYDLGYMQGEYLAETLKENAQILYMMNTLGSDSQVGRDEGLKAALADKGRTDITFLSEMEAKSQEQALQVMEDWINAYPTFDAVVSQTDKGVGGAVEALKATGRLDEDMVIISIDADSIGCNAIENGSIYGSVAQDMPVMMEKCAEYIYQYVTEGNLDGVEDKTIVPGFWVTAENLEEYKSVRFAE